MLNDLKGYHVIFKVEEKSMFLIKSWIKQYLCSKKDTHIHTHTGTNKRRLKEEPGYLTLYRVISSLNYVLKA